MEGREESNTEELVTVAAQEAEPERSSSGACGSCVMVSDGPQGAGAPPEEGRGAPEVTHMSSNSQQVPPGGAPSSASAKPPASSTATEDEDESEDESQILEESPCGRWQKRREEVTD